MSFRSAIVDRVLLVWWDRQPHQDDLNAVLDQARALRRTAAGDVLFLASIPPQPLELPLRDALARYASELCTIVSEIHLIVSAEMRVPSIVRSSLKGVVIASHSEAQTSVHPSLDEALVALHTKVDVVAVRRAIAALEAE
jgi:hypothetical protein